MSQERLKKIALWCAAVLLFVVLVTGGRTVFRDFGAASVVGKSAEITHVTAGIIEADTLIAVRFSLPQVGEDSIGKPLTKSPFAFSPEIKGTAYWEDVQTLVFKPAEPLYTREDYTGTLTLEGGEMLNLAFSTRGQGLTEASGHFVPAPQGGEGQVYFTGTLTFSERVDQALLRDNLRLKLGDRLLPYNLQTTDKLSYQIRSEELERYPEHYRVLEVELKGGPLGLAKDLKFDHVLTPLASVLEVVHIAEEKAGDFSRLRITFSDELATGRDYKGYLNITPAVDFSVQATGNQLLLTGEFRPREKYSIEFFPGLESVHGRKLDAASQYLWEVQISDLKPAVEFIDGGIILTSTAPKRIAFRTMNVNRLRLQVKKVTEDNLLAFYEENAYRPSTYAFDEYNRYHFLRHGEVIEDRIIEIGSETNRWIRSELDLSKVLEAHGNALYVIQLNFDETQALYFPPEMGRWEIWDQVALRGQTVKHVIVSDVGITAKEMLGDLHVFVTNLLTAEPIPQAVVILKDNDGGVLSLELSDEQGLASLKSHQDGRYIEVWAGEMGALMNLPASRLNTAIFDTGGVQKQDGIDAFIYSERGVYRPGDLINLSAIIRNEDHTFPDHHPVTWRIYNSRDQLIYEETSTTGRDGFYSCSFPTATNAPTGNWQAQLQVGGRIFRHDLKIEEIVPYRLRVDADVTVPEVKSSDDAVEFTLRSQYLFGAPAAGLESESTIYLEPYAKTFPAYTNFTFDNPTVGFITQERSFRLKLDDAGQARLVWDLPQIGTVPSALRLRVESKVFESGGRAVPYTMLVPVEHYSSYVGIRQLADADLGMGDAADFTIVHLTSEGEPIAASELEYTMYRLRRYWWWEYSSEADFRRYFKQNEQLVVAATGQLKTDEKGLAQLAYQPEDYGEIILEVKDPVGGHSAAYFFRAYWWGEGAESSTPAALTLKLDKEYYVPGDTARVKLAAPIGSKALVTVEKEGKLLEHRWYQVDRAEMEFAVQVTEEYMPNAYLSVMVLQPHERANDLPVRLYGIAPLHVKSAETEIKIGLDLPELIRPEEKFTVKIQTENKQPVQFTLAVVDEGLLNITGFRTPDPHGHFFAKQRLLTRNYDNFADVIDFTFGYLDNVFTVGGGEEADYQEMQVPKQDELRFRAVSLFVGPMETDENGYAEVELELPNYMGSVRVMVVAAAGGCYGSAEQTVPVKAPLMVLPTLPRVLRPGDQITVPVTVFALAEDIGVVEVALLADGPVEIIGPRRQLIGFGGEGTAEITFQLAALAEMGTADIVVQAVSTGNGYLSQDRTALPIRAASPYIFLSQEQLAGSAETVTFTAPPPGIPGTDRLQVSISPWRGLNIEHRLQWLIRYPYLCLEQTTSAAFRQLYLAYLVQLEMEKLEEIDENVNAAIGRMREYQLMSGGFAYWPGDGVPELWSTNYAGHFLLEAKSRGYHVPDDILAGWVKFQREAARANAGTRHTRAYRLYLLALADSPELSAMNYMRESELDRLSSLEKHLLAAAYWTAGYPETADTILVQAELDVADQTEREATFGSTLRDLAMLLDSLVVVGDYERSAPLYEHIAGELASNRWYSTQTTAYGLLAVSRYISDLSEELPSLRGDLVVDGEVIPLTAEGTAVVVPLPHEAEQIAFTNKTDVPLFVTLTWEGIPESKDLKPEQNKLRLSVNYFDREGRQMDVSQLGQGTEFYALYRVSQEGHEDLSEVALVQVLPAGWEIENVRLLGGRLPEWTEEYNLGQEEFLDLRDDRVMWFFDMYGWVEEYCFLVKLNAVTVGKFTLPPTLLEAMYDNEYKVVTEGSVVEVLAR
ncbi:MAG: MG2 domain-containing protein [Limnochordia bacterium]